MPSPGQSGHDQENEANNVAQKMISVATVGTSDQQQVPVSTNASRRTVQEYQKQLSTKKERLTKTEELAIKAMEKVNDKDEFTLEDVMSTIKEFDSLKTQVTTGMSQLKMLLGVMTFVFILLTGTIFGLMWATIELTKEYRPESTGQLKTTDGQLVGTSASAYSSPLGALATASKGQLRSLSSVDITGRDGWTTHKVASVSKNAEGSVIIKTQEERTIVVERDGSVYLDGAKSGGGRRLSSQEEAVVVIMSNTAEDSGAVPVAPCVVFTEVHPRPSSGNTEYVELYNKCSTAQSLAGWMMEDLKGYKGVFKSDSIAGGSYVSVEFKSKLNNVGDTVFLYNSQSVKVGELTYNEQLAVGKSFFLSEEGMWVEGAATRDMANPGPTVTTTTTTTPPSKDGMIQENDLPLPCGGTCDGICFGTWNIQNVGQSKLGRDAVMTKIREVLSRYDVAVIQEISQMPDENYASSCGDYSSPVICDGLMGRGKSDTLLDAYDFSASPRIGDEQFMLMWKKNVASLKTGVTTNQATYPDSQGKHSRPPHAWHLEISNAIDGTDKSWDLAIGSTHTTPHQAEQEILNFPNVLSWMATTFSNAGVDSLIAGDYNADGSYFKDHNHWPDNVLNSEFDGYDLLTPNSLDTTVASSSNAYDRIIANSALAERTSSAGKAADILNLEDLEMTQLRLEGCRESYVNDEYCGDSLPTEVRQKLAGEISDHHPVEMCLPHRN